uniref:P/Homo B domain-containing protein n=1 Tax=Scophthalmus maximus TaxID=52904 RepID=A0A8D3A986_SCOMX
MEANNSYCGVGIAFNARIGGIRLLNGSVTDAMEATALTFNIHLIDIYVCSWGPRDDGAELDGPHVLTEQALRLGTHEGRGGKGSVFVWAAGNGGMQHDHCGADGYVNSIHSVAIGAVTQTGKPAYFGEPCPGVMAVTLTGAGVGGALPLVTVTAVADGCVTHFPGTSSAAPIAAGILALVLEVNPELTWRDVQHLVASTAKIPDPEEPGWNINAAGYHVHHRYGFGLLDAGLMVQQAALFNAVAPQRRCTQDVTLDPSRYKKKKKLFISFFFWYVYMTPVISICLPYLIFYFFSVYTVNTLLDRCEDFFYFSFLSVRILSPGGGISVDIQSEACRGRTNEISSLEHVQVRVSVSAACRGDLSISLESPGGTVSLLLDARPNDASAAGLKNWTLMTVHCWGEGPRGLWTLRVTDRRGTVRSCARPSEEEAAGALLAVTLVLYGTSGPRRAAHGRPLQSIVSMGSRHLVPHAGAHQTGRRPPLGLIQWIYRMERDRKVRAADITKPAGPQLRPTSGQESPTRPAAAGRPSRDKDQPR